MSQYIRFPNPVISTGSIPVVVTSPLPAGSNTIGGVTQSSGPWTMNLTQVGSTSVTLGQKLMAASVPVVISSDQSPVPVTGSITATNPSVDLTGGAVPASATYVGFRDASGNLRAAQLTAANSLPTAVVEALPAGSNTIGAVTQASGPWTIDLTKVGGAAFALGQALMAASIPVTIASNQSTINVAVASALPAGGNTIGAVTQASGPWTSNITQVGGASLALGQALMAASVPVVIASNQSTLNVAVASALPAGANTIGAVTQASGPWTVSVTQASGRSVVTTVRNDYSSVNVTTGAWVQLVASLSATVNMIEIFDSSGQTLEIGTGAVASETRLIILTPGGNGQVPVTIASGTRVSIRAISATASSGELDINFYG